VTFCRRQKVGSQPLVFFSEISLPRVPVGRCDEQGGAAEAQQTAAPRDEPPSGADENTVWETANAAAGFVERGAL